ncbi:MAG: ATP-binding cassette domain-containing protein [Oligoflexia bacterium]|nr:ATP-binding cassette domain-containing protein [Oligoflexia bacterium]
MSLLRMENISKDFGGVLALQMVNFDIEPGEIHALCGENGAGKSTLMKILSGVYPQGSFNGRIVIEGAPKHFSSIRDSERSGIAIIHQELSLIPEQSIGENIFLGREPQFAGFIQWSKLFSDAQKLLKVVGLNANVRRPVKELGVGQQQLVEIAKALSQNPRILVLDEPTSALTKEEIANLLRLLKRLKSEGMSSILISHKLDEVLEVADRVTVLRDGSTIATHDRHGLTETQIISEMVGREVSTLFPESSRQPGQVVFEVENLNVADAQKRSGYLLKDISFKVRAGEILGIGGLMGSGRSELLQALFGGLRLPVQCETKLMGVKTKIHSPSQAWTQGVAFVPEDRKRQGLVLDDSVSRNMTISGLELFSKFGFLKSLAMASHAKDMTKKLKVKTSSVEAPVKSLSGGNQQKVVLAKCLTTKPKILFLDEPTRGIDVGAKQEIYTLITDLASQGMAVVLVSSELPELMGLADRILVLNEGRITGELERSMATPEKIMTLATQSVFGGVDVRNYGF